MFANPKEKARGYYFGIGAFFVTLALVVVSGLGPRMSAADRLLPHGFCYQWDPSLIRLHVVSDTMIGLAYVAIPITLVTFIRRRTDLPFNWMFLLFGLFIVACGATHWMEVWTLWQPSYWLSGGVKAVTAAASIPTAILLYMLVPQALAIPTARELREARGALEALKRANALLEEQRRALEDADRRKDEFLAILSHELRNPVHAVRMGAMLLDLKAADPEAKEVAAAIARQTGHLGHLLDDLLDVVHSRSRPPLHREPWDLREVLQAAVETVRGRIEERGQQLELDLPAGPLEVKVDRARLRQAITNLLANAALYSERGGRITVLLRREAGEVRLSVRDQGIGFDTHEAAELFQLFARGEQAKRRAEGGLGIGLFVTKEVVEAHGGRIEAFSAGRGQGAEFVIRLPVA